MPCVIAVLDSDLARDTREPRKFREPLGSRVASTSVLHDAALFTANNGYEELQPISLVESAGGSPCRPQEGFRRMIGDVYLTVILVL